MVAVIVTVVVLAGVIADICFFIWWFKRLRMEAIESMRGDVGEEKVYHVEDCNFFGRQSAGYRQWRGNGVLALTEKGIHFRMLLPRKELFIPLDSIKEISHPRSFLGKSKARDLLRVDFVNEAGEEDACAWLVPSLQWWSDAISALRVGEEPPAPPWKHHA